jgi:ankyrin repeat protein
MLLAFPRVDVNLREGGGLTALHLAVLYNNKELVTMFVKDKRVDREATLNN